MKQRYEFPNLNPHSYKLVVYFIGVMQYVYNLTIPLRFLNGGVLRNLNMYSFQKLCPVCVAGQLEVPQQAGRLSD